MGGDLAGNGPPKKEDWGVTWLVSQHGKAGGKAARRLGPEARTHTERPEPRCRRSIRDLRAAQHLAAWSVGVRIQFANFVGRSDKFCVLCRSRTFSGRRRSRRGVACCKRAVAPGDVQLQAAAARRPVTEPFGHAGGNAGSRCSSPA